jgi:hypothetical protein
MGTNYYLRTDVCAHCSRERERIHVGKSSAGWPFLFRGYRKWPPDGVPHPITSAKEWRDFIARAIKFDNAKLFDEYGKEQDVEKLWEFAKSKLSETRGPEASPGYRHGDRDSEWIDAEGYRFCDNEFS